ncbi:MAG: helix-turn-helix transcriptional regulator, partial [Acidimicrobiia bacterium]
METSARLLKLLSLLQARPTWTGPELASRLEVTDRTLRRDVARLRSLGYPVEAVSGPHGGYELVPGGAIPPLLLDDDEAVAVAVGLRAAAAGGMIGFEDAALAALAKIEAVLPNRLRTQVGSLHSATVVEAGRQATPVDPTALVKVARACQRPERLRFTYKAADGAITQRNVEPYHIVHLTRRWYLVAFDRDRDDWRSFRVDRMSNVVETGMWFEAREAPDPVALVSEGMAVSAYRWQARVTLFVPFEDAGHFIPRTVGVLEPAGKTRTLLRLGADDL